MCSLRTRCAPMSTVVLLCTPMVAFVTLRGMDTTELHALTDGERRSVVGLKTTKRPRTVAGAKRHRRRLVVFVFFSQQLE